MTSNRQKILPIIIVIVSGLLLGLSQGFAQNVDDGPWQVSSGADKVFSFRPDYIPYRSAFLAYAVPEKANRLIVTPRGHSPSGESPYKWQPKDRPYGSYVYLLDLKANQMDFLPWNEFTAFKYRREIFRSQSASKYPALKPAGKLFEDAMVLPIKKPEREFTAVISYDSKRSVDRSFGIPSIIPFMGRKKFVEKEVSYSGTIYLEIFNTVNPSTPLIQLKKEFKNWSFLPTDAGYFVDWAINTDRPYLLLMDIKPNEYETAMEGRIIIISPTDIH